MQRHDKLGGRLAGPATRPSLLIRMRSYNKNDNDDAWQEFVWNYGPCILAWIRKWINNDADKEEVLQETLRRLFCRIRTFEYDSDHSFRAYLHRIAASAAFTYLRRKNRPLLMITVIRLFPVNGLADTLIKLSMNGASTSLDVLETRLHDCCGGWGLRPVQANAVVDRALSRVRQRRKKSKAWHEMVLQEVREALVLHLRGEQRVMVVEQMNDRIPDCHEFIAELEKRSECEWLRIQWPAIKALLTPEQQVVVELHVFCKLDWKSVAYELDIDKTTAEMRFGRAVRKLKDHYAGKGT
jgi:RNA polymerase sigma factor (sigma-70 family)